jgi:hypothetical protein
MNRSCNCNSRSIPMLSPLYPHLLPCALEVSDLPSVHPCNIPALGLRNRLLQVEAQFSVRQYRACVSPADFPPCGENKLLSTAVSRGLRRSYLHKVILQVPNLGHSHSIGTMKLKILRLPQYPIMNYYTRPRYKKAIQWTISSPRRRQKTRPVLTCQKCSTYSLSPS